MAGPVWLEVEGLVAGVDDLVGGRRGAGTMIRRRPPSADGSPMGTGTGPSVVSDIAALVEALNFGRGFGRGFS